jgi:uncharacterized membrane protein
MPTYVYHILHVVGLVLLFTGFGGLLSNEPGVRRTAMKFHGIGLLVLLIAGFGFIASSNKGTVAPEASFSYMSPFVIAKIVIFLIMGALPVLFKKRVFPPAVLIVIAVAIAMLVPILRHLEVLPIR